MLDADPTHQILVGHRSESESESMGQKQFAFKLTGPLAPRDALKQALNNIDEEIISHAFVYQSFFANAIYIFHQYQNRWQVLLSIMHGSSNSLVRMANCHRSETVDS